MRFETEIVNTLDMTNEREVDARRVNPTDEILDDAVLYDAYSEVLRRAVFCRGKECRQFHGSRSSRQDARLKRSRRPTRR